MAAPESSIQKAANNSLNKYKKKQHNAACKRAEKIAKNQVARAKYYQESQRFSQIVSERCQKNRRRHFVIVTGGGPGIMEAANRGAQDAKAKSIGLNIVLPHEQSPNPYISPELCFQFHYFAIRKMHFLIRARALVCFPGGYGTLDELFEALKYWSKLINFKFLVSEGMVDAKDLKLFHYVESAEQAWKIIATFYKLPQ